MKILRAILILATLAAFIALSKEMLEHKGGETSEWLIVWSAWIGLVLNFIYLVGWRFASRDSLAFGSMPKESSKGLMATFRRRFIPALVSIIIVCGIGVGAYLLSRPATPPTIDTSDEAMEHLLSPLKRCVNMVRQEDDYALWQDNKQRVANWCDDNRLLFSREPKPPSKDQLTKAEEKTMNICVGRIIQEGSLPEPHRAIEDIFDKVRTIQFAKEQCYYDAWKAVKQKLRSPTKNKIGLLPRLDSATAGRIFSQLDSQLNKDSTITMKEKPAKSIS